MGGERATQERKAQCLPGQTAPECAGHRSLSGHRTQHRLGEQGVRAGDRSIRAGHGGQKMLLRLGLTKRCRNCTVVNALASGKTCEAELTPQTQDHWPESRGYWLSRAAPVTDGAGNTIGAMEA